MDNGIDLLVFCDASIVFIVAVSKGSYNAIGKSFPGYTTFNTLGVHRSNGTT